MYMTYVEQSWIFAASHNHILEAPAVTLVSDALPLGQVARGILKLKGSWEVHVFNVPIPQTSEMCLFFSINPLIVAFAPVPQLLLSHHKTQTVGTYILYMIYDENENVKIEIYIYIYIYISTHCSFFLSLFLPNCPPIPGGYRQP